MNPIRDSLRHARHTLLHYRLVRRGLLTGRPSAASAPKRGRTESRAGNEGVPPFRQGEGDALSDALNRPSGPARTTDGNGAPVSESPFARPSGPGRGPVNPLLETSRSVEVAARSEGQSPRCPVGLSPSPLPGRDPA